MNCSRPKYLSNLLSIFTFLLVSCSYQTENSAVTVRGIASANLSGIKIPSQCSSPDFYIVGNASFEDRVEVSSQTNTHSPSNSKDDQFCQRQNAELVEKLKKTEARADNNYEAWRSQKDLNFKEKAANSDKWIDHYNNYKCNRKGSCFAAGTKIRTENGWVNIEDIRVGDTVRAYDHKKDKIVLSKVIKTRMLTKPVCKITVGAQEILATPDHPFFSIDQDRYLPIANLVKLEKNQVAKFSDKMDMLVNRSVSSVEYVGEDEVFDIRVETYHNFFIDGDILVHNW